VWTSKKASDAEAMMTNAFASHNASEIVFECVAAVLPFSDGVAAGGPIVGFRTSASDLITSGKIDLRAQSLDLRGRVRAKQGMTLGLATIAGDVKIEGPLRHPTMKLDPDAKALAVLRAGAAIATLGLSALGTAFIDAAEAGQDDPCKAPFSRK
jgi:hypothetical protein